MSNATPGSVSFSSPGIPDAIARDVSVIHKGYPRIGETITRLWGSVDLSAYLNSVIFDERGSRQGFAEPTASALFRVYESQRASAQRKKSGDIWDVILEPLKK